jgi:hypothetical protein
VYSNISGIFSLYSVKEQDASSICFAVINKQDPTCLIEDLQIVELIEYGKHFINMQFNNKKVYCLTFEKISDCLAANEKLNNLLQIQKPGVFSLTNDDIFKKIGAASSKRDFIQKYITIIAVIYRLNSRKMRMCRIYFINNTARH